MEVARFKRLQHTMIRFMGEVCPHCDKPMFPPRDVCPECRGEGNKPEEVTADSVFKTRKITLIKST